MKKNKNKKKKAEMPDLGSHDEMIAAWMKEPAFKAEYDALEDEYKLLREMLLARKRSGLTQADVAERMGTKASAVARLESGGGQGRHSPGLGTLRKYAKAVNCELIVSLRPLSRKGVRRKSA